MKQTCIRVEDLRVQCLIGAWPQERHAPQEIRVDLEVVTDGRRAAGTDDLNHAVDYSVLTDTVRFVLQEGHFKLLETGVHMLQRVLLIPPTDPKRARIQEVSVRLTKFGALRDGARAVVESRLTGAELEYEQELKSWGTVDVVGETGDVGIYRLNIAPGQCLPAHYHQQMREAEFVLDPGLSGQWDGANHTLMVGQRFAWPRGQIHGYQNHSDQTGSLLCIDQPTFIPEDERVVVEDIQ